MLELPLAGAGAPVPARLHEPQGPARRSSSLSPWSRRRPRRRSSPATAPASPAATGRCGRSSCSRRGLPAGRPIGPREIASRLEVRRVPERFVPAGALAVPDDALGLVPLGPAPGRLLPARLAAAPAAPTAAAGLWRAAAGRSRSRSAAPTRCWRCGRASGSKVDVVVTTEPSGAGPGRTYVAAAGVPLLALGPGRRRPGPGRRLGGDAGADPGAGAAADRGRELRPEADPAPAAVSGGGRPTSGRSRSSPRPCARG